MQHGVGIQGNSNGSKKSRTKILTEFLFQRYENDNIRGRMRHFDGNCSLQLMRCRYKLPIINRKLQGM